MCVMLCVMVYVHGVCAYCASIYMCVYPIVYVCAWCGYTGCVFMVCMHGLCVPGVCVCVCRVCVPCVCLVRVPRVHVCTHVCARACPCPSYVFLPFPSLCPCFPEVIPVPDKASFIPIAMFLHPSLLLANLLHATSRDTGYKIEVRLPSG